MLKFPDWNSESFDAIRHTILLMSPQPKNLNEIHIGKDKFFFNDIVKHAEMMEIDDFELFFKE